MFILVRILHKKTILAVTFPSHFKYRGGLKAMTCWFQKLEFNFKIIFFAIAL